MSLQGLRLGCCGGCRVACIGNIVGKRGTVRRVAQYATIPLLATGVGVAFIMALWLFSDWLLLSAIAISLMLIIGRFLMINALIKEKQL